MNPPIDPKEGPEWAAECARVDAELGHRLVTDPKTGEQVAIRWQDERAWDLYLEDYWEQRRLDEEEARYTRPVAETACESCGLPSSFAWCPRCEEDDARTFAEPERYRDPGYAA